MALVVMPGPPLPPARWIAVDRHHFVAQRRHVARMAAAAASQVQHGAAGTSGA
jgi:hypothetical protein